MANKGRSVPDALGGYTHYDEKGKKIGRSVPGLFGSYTNYDAKGHKIGSSHPTGFGGMVHYDDRGHKIGRSDRGALGSLQHYDEKGHRTGRSDPDAFGGYKTTDQQGCYIATCVYGSYDCPEVWVLRRFRDRVLRNCVSGRLFIRLYYAVSPSLVRLFGHQSWFQIFWKSKLDVLVRRLKENGIEETPYSDGC
ncbi:MAG: hypothetical protein J6P39_00235 [Oscillospiraceae bacterium]|nr:hypothetical protein [Oscillospiraceae bacterium]